MTTIGYARALRLEDREAQQLALQAEGVERIYCDATPAGIAERPVLMQAISALAKGDALCAVSASVVAGVCADLVAVLDRVHERGATVTLIDMSGVGRLDTSTAAGRLMVKMIRGVAAFEREARDERVGTLYSGRTPKARRQRAEIQRLRAEGLRPREIARKLNISERSVYINSLRS